MGDQWPSLARNLISSPKLLSFISCFHVLFLFMFSSPNQPMYECFAFLCFFSPFYYKCNNNVSSKGNNALLSQPCVIQAWQLNVILQSDLCNPAASVWQKRTGLGRVFSWVNEFCGHIYTSMYITCVIQSCSALYLSTLYVQSTSHVCMTGTHGM